jgi:hypothetical protein
MFLLITEQMRNYWKFRMRMPMRKILRKTMMEDEDDSENNDTGDEDGCSMPQSHLHTKKQNCTISRYSNRRLVAEGGFDGADRTWLD